MPANILVTGSSTGFGRAAVELLARQGHTVFATMRDPHGRNSGHRESLERLAADEQLRLRVLELDVTRQASVDRVAGEAGTIDVLINNAGVAALGTAEAYTPEDFQQLFDTNFFGVVRITRALLPRMRAQRRGLVLYVSSIAGRLASPYMAPYCASKFALEALADCYRFEQRPFGIDHVLIEPGAYPTEVFRSSLVPSDRGRTLAYGEDDYTHHVVESFANILSAPDRGSNEELAKVFARLIDMPAGTRPHRVPVGVMAEKILPAYNAAYEQLRPAMLGLVPPGIAAKLSD